MARTRESEDLGWADSPRETKYPRIRLRNEERSVGSSGGTYLRNPPSSCISRSFSPLIFKIAGLKGQMPHQHIANHSNLGFMRSQQSITFYT